MLPVSVRAQMLGTPSGGMSALKVCRSLTVRVTLAFLVLLLLAWEPPAQQPEAKPTPVTTQEYIDLYEQDLSHARSTVPVEVGDLVHLTVEVVAETDSDYGDRCAEPTVKDSFGNVMAVLSPMRESRVTHRGVQEARRAVRPCI